MPFDFTPTELKPIDKLIYALRGPEPSDWNFARRCQCAMQIACDMGLAREPYPRVVALAMGMSEDAGVTIFEPPEYTRPQDSLMWHSVRPRHVAAALEHYRDSGEALSPFIFVERERAAQD